MSAAPRLSIGLPVYNGAAHLAESIEALCGQTYEDFELIISDNASADETAEICHFYEGQDARIRCFHQPRNIGAAANHNFVVQQARGELFKFAAHDDLYARDLLERCVRALDELPDIVLCHSWVAMIDESANVTSALEYPLATSAARAPDRFRSALFGRGGDDFYGVIRRNALGPALHQDNHHRSDRTMVTAWTLYGPFYQVPEWLYFRREHPQLTGTREDEGRNSQDWPERDWPRGRASWVNIDPRRANRWRHPAVRLYAEYLGGYIRALHHAPLSTTDRWKCYRYLALWAADRAHLTHARQLEPPVRAAESAISVDALVAGRKKANV